MSDVALRPAQDGDAVFATRTVALMLVIGIAGFIGMLVLGAYAPDFRSGRDGGTHALSNAAVGFSGIVRLADATGRHPRIVRDPHLFGSEDLLVLTPPNGFVDISPALEGRRTKPTLFVLPKWDVAADPGHRGWVRQSGLTWTDSPEGVLSPVYNLVIRRHPSGGRRLTGIEPFARDIALVAPRPLQVIAGIRPAKAARKGGPVPPLPDFTPLLTDSRGGAVLARLGKGPLYVLADPDLLANKGLRDPAQAAAALAMLDWLNSTGAEGIDFDVTANGLGHSQSPLKLAFEPPFLAMTLTIAAAAAMAGLHALGRFGPVQRRERAIAFGKAALVDNSAALVRKAGREARLGPRYVAAMRDRASLLFGVPARLRGAEIDAYLDRFGKGPRFADLARTAEGAADRTALVDAARALHGWHEGTKR